MTAEEARDRTKRRIMVLTSFQFDRVIAEIEVCISEGKFILWTSQDLYPENKQKLIDAGFNVNPSRREETYGGALYKITWYEKNENEKNTKKGFFSFLKG